MFEVLRRIVNLKELESEKMSKFLEEHNTQNEEKWKQDKMKEI